MAEQQDPLTSELVQELALDSTEENNEVVSGLLKSSREIVADSVNKNLNASELDADPIYSRAVKALTTALFYDRSLSGGVPAGVEMMITHLKGRYATWPDSKKQK